MCGYRGKKLRNPGDTCTWRGSHLGHDRAVQSHHVRVGSVGLVASHKACPQSPWEYCKLLRRNHLQSVFLDDSKEGPRNLTVC